MINKFINTYQQTKWLACRRWRWFRKQESIGIEIAVNQDGDYNKALENAKRLAGYLMNKEGIGADHIYKHQQWSGKKCPDILISRGNGLVSYKNSVVCKYKCAD